MELREIEMQCPFCAGKEVKFAFSAAAERLENDIQSETFDYLSCNSCQSIFLESIPPEEVLSHYYESDDYHVHQASSLGRIRSLYYQLSLEFPAGQGSLLEIGPGPGLFLQFASKRGWSVEGMEFSREAAKAAEQGGFTIHVWGDELERHSFDYIVLIHTFEHLPNPREVMKMIRHLLKPDGKCLIEIPSLNFWEFKVFSNKHGLVQAPIHLHFGSDRGLEVVAKEAGMCLTRKMNNPYNSLLPSSVLNCLGLEKSMSRRLRMRTNLLLAPLMIPVNLALSKTGMSLGFRVYEFGLEPER